MYDQKKTRPDGRVPSGKQRSHWNGVLERRQNHRVSRISAAEERVMPAKMVKEIRAMARLWKAGMGPSGTGRPDRFTRRRVKWRRRERVR